MRKWRRINNCSAGWPHHRIGCTPNQNDFNPGPARQLIGQFLKPVRRPTLNGKGRPGVDGHHQVGGRDLVFLEKAINPPLRTGGNLERERRFSGADSQEFQRLQIEPDAVKFPPLGQAAVLEQAETEVIPLVQAQLTAGSGKPPNPMAQPDRVQVHEYIVTLVTDSTDHLENIPELPPDIPSRTLVETQNLIQTGVHCQQFPIPRTGQPRDASSGIGRAQRGGDRPNMDNITQRTQPHDEDAAGSAGRAPANSRCFVQVALIIC